MPKGERFPVVNLVNKFFQKLPNCNTLLCSPASNSKPFLSCLSVTKKPCQALPRWTQRTSSISARACGVNVPFPFTSNLSTILGSSTLNLTWTFPPWLRGSSILDEPTYLVASKVSACRGGTTTNSPFFLNVTPANRLSMFHCWTDLLVCSITCKA